MSTLRGIPPLEDEIIIEWANIERLFPAGYLTSRKRRILRDERVVMKRLFGRPPNRKWRVFTIRSLVQRFLMLNENF
jgi:hypothetical protein